MRSVEQTVNKICECRGLKPSEVFSRARGRALSDTRKMISAILRPRMGLVELGEVLGGKHHASVIYYLREHETLMECDYVYRESFDDVMAAMSTGKYL